MKLEDTLFNKKVIIITMCSMLFSGLFIAQKSVYIIGIILLFYLMVRINLFNKKLGKVLYGFNDIKSNISKWDIFFSFGWIFIGLLKVNFFKQPLTKLSAIGAIYNVLIGIFYFWLILENNKITDLGLVINYKLYEWSKIKAIRLYRKDSNVLLVEVYDEDSKNIIVEKIDLRNKKKDEVIEEINKYRKNGLNMNGG